MVGSAWHCHNNPIKVNSNGESFLWTPFVVQCFSCADLPPFRAVNSIYSQNDFVSRYVCCSLQNVSEKRKMPNIHGWICAVVSRFRFHIPHQLSNKARSSMHHKFVNSTTASPFQISDKASGMTYYLTQIVQAF